jgi:plastocyanin
MIGAIALLAGFALIAEASNAARPSTHTIIIAKMRFGAVPPNIKAGDMIVWINQAIVAHTATARDGSFDVELPPGSSASVVVSRPGTIAFFCRYHPTMRGSLVVAR